MDHFNTQLLKEQHAFADAQQILHDFNKFIHNGGLDVVGANPYDRQQCYDKYETLEVMLKARQDEYYHRQNRRGRGGGGGGGGFILEDVELNLTILNEIVLSAVYFMVPSNETRRVMNSGKIELLCKREPREGLFDERYHNQNIPRWLNLLPQHLFESYDPDVTAVDINETPSARRKTYMTASPQSTLSKPKLEQDLIQQQLSPASEPRSIQTPRKPDDRHKEYPYLSHRNRSANYRSTITHGEKLRYDKWFSFCGCGRRASIYS